ncbi:MAG TPA: ROK family protein [Dehalococcoidia bacterium]|nr:ROK family protein [Dehalococcoidia bacterium]
MPPLYAGIDIGGTKILSIVAQDDGRIIGEQQIATPVNAEPAVVLNDAAACARAAADLAGVPWSDIAAAGIAIAGPADYNRALVTESPNLPAWRNVPAGAIIGELLGRPALLENDANAAALGEHRFGAGQGTRHMVYLTVSTGIGGGIIIDGRLYRGASGSAGEFGHMVVQPDGARCGCGNHGCLETVASGTAIERDAAQALAEGYSGPLARMLDASREMRAEFVEAAAKEGDEVAAAIIRTAGERFGVGLAAIVNILNPEVIVVGGGVSNMGERYLGPAEEAMRRHAFDLPARAVELRLAALGKYSAALGAVVLASEGRRQAAPEGSA